MTGFDRYLHTIMVQGEHEARKDGSTAMEAHHLLLAIAAEREATTHRMLAAAGLDYQAIRDALDGEYEHSLKAAGVSRDAFDLPEPSYPAGRKVGIGASARLALERGIAAVARKKDLRPGHVLLGVLKAEVGTVPRALALAGIDPADLATRVRAALPGPDAGPDEDGAR